MLGSCNNQLVLDKSPMNRKNGKRFDLLIRLGQLVPRAIVFETERVGEAPREANITKCHEAKATESLGLAARTLRTSSLYSAQASPADLYTRAAVTEDGQRRNTRSRASSRSPGRCFSRRTHQ